MAPLPPALVEHARTVKNVSGGSFEDLRRKQNAEKSALQPAFERVAARALDFLFHVRREREVSKQR